MPDAEDLEMGKVVTHTPARDSRMFTSKPQLIMARARSSLYPRSVVAAVIIAASLSIST